MSRAVPFTAARKPWRVLLGGALVAGLALGTAACVDTVLAPNQPAPNATAATRLECTADVRGGTLECAGPPPSGARRVIVGGQNVYVRLASTPGGYDTATELYTIHVTVQNLLDQAMGTLDGVTPHPDGVRVHFYTGPSSAQGNVSVHNPTGTGTFLGSEQPFFQYDGVLGPDSVTAAQPWQFRVPATVTGFKFSVYVQAALEERIVITEVMPNPSAASDEDGEFFEVYNPGLDPVNLNGWKITSKGGRNSVEKNTGHTVASDVLVPARGYAVIGRNTNRDYNGGIAVDYSVGSSITLANSSASEFLAIRSPAGVLVDSVHVGGTGIPIGRSRELLDVAADNLVMSGAAWNTAYARFGTGSDTGEFDRGTPGAANSPAITVGPVVALQISPAYMVIDTVGQFRRFTALAEDSLGQAATGAVTWATTDPSVATIDAAGRVTQVDTGRVHIVATAENGVADTTLYSIFTYSPAAVYRNHVEF